MNPTRLHTRTALFIATMLTVFGCSEGPPTDGASSAPSQSDAVGNAAAGSTGAGGGAIVGGGNGGDGGGGAGGGWSTTADFYVATNGCDTCNWTGKLSAPNAGMTDGPFASIGAAQVAVRALKATRTDGNIVVHVRAGTYYQPTTLTFADPSDSGSMAVPIIWESYPGEMPIVSGGLRITGWTMSSPGVWRATLPSSIVPFENLYYNGARRLRPRVGSTATDVVAPFLRVASEYYAPSPTTTCPSQSLVSGKGYKCFDRFYYDPSDPISASWKNLSPPNGNPCGQAPGPSALAGDIEIDLFEDWTMEKMRISCIDSANHVIYFTAPTPPTSGMQINFWGPVTGHRYVIENVQDLLAYPRQWFLDQSTTPPTLTYVAAAGEDPNTDVVVVPQAQPVVSIQKAEWLTFRGITFEADNFVPPPSGFNADDNGENRLPAAVECQSCQNVLLDQVTVRQTSATGLLIATIKGSNVPAAHVTVSDSRFYDIGAVGVHVGHSPTSSDRDDTVPQFITLSNNRIEGFSRMYASGQGISSGSMHDVLITHNEITDGYHTGLSICEGGCPFGATSSHGTFNVVSTYNRIWNMMQGITSDGGALYYHLGGPNQTALGGKILHNVVHDVTDSSIIDAGVRGSAYGGDGIYLDNQTGGVDVEHNVVYRVSEFGIHFSKGPAPGMPANTFNNNIIAFARLGLFHEALAWPQGCGVSSPLRANLTHNLFYFDKSDDTGFFTVQGCAYSCGLPFDQFQNFAGNLYWRTDGKFAAYNKQFHVATAVTDEAMCTGGNKPSDWTFLSLAQWQASPQDEDAGSVIADPGFADPKFPVDDFTLASSPISGFDATQTNDTLANAGRNGGPPAPAAVPATFPTYHYDPNNGF